MLMLFPKGYNMSGIDVLIESLQIIKNLSAIISPVTYKFRNLDKQM